MTYLIIQTPDTTSPLATFESSEAERLVSEVLGTNLREIFPYEGKQTTNHEAIAQVVETLLDQLHTQTPGFPGLFGQVAEPQDIHDQPEHAISDEDRARIRWQQAYTRGNEPWVRFSFETPLPTSSTAGHPDPRIQQLEQELQGLQQFLQTAQAQPGSSVSAQPAPTTPTPAPVAPAPVPTDTPVSTPVPDQPVSTIPTTTDTPVNTTVPSSPETPAPNTPVGEATPEEQQPDPNQAHG